MDQQLNSTSQFFLSETDGHMRSKIITIPRIRSGPATYGFPTTNRAIKPINNNKYGNAFIITRSFSKIVK